MVIVVRKMNNDMKPCKKCGKLFTSKSMGGHVSHCGKIKIKKECSICFKMISENMFDIHFNMHKKDTKCLNCGKYVIGKSRNIFCSHSCAAHYNNKIKGFKQRSNKTTKCNFCGKPTLKPNGLCSKECKKNYNYVIYMHKWFDKEVSGNYGENEDSFSMHVRRWIAQRSGNKCEALLENGKRCNWSTVNKFTNKVPLAIHHKDGNYKNTTMDNIIHICPNCHSLTESYGSRNKGSGRETRKAWRNKIK
jgi:hypothetical protein